MKNRRLYFPAYEMLLFLMIAAVSVVLVILQTKSRQLTREAELLTNGVTAARSAAECWMGCDNIEQYQQVSNATNTNGDYSFVDSNGYNVVLNQSKDDAIYKALIEVYYENEMVYSINISKAGQRYE